MPATEQVGFRADSIRELMARDGLSLNEFIEKSGFSRQLVGGWLAGTVHPTFRSVLLLCRRFDVDPGFFAEGVEPNGAGAKTTTGRG